jgi:hypothetical protein
MRALPTAIAVIFLGLCAPALAQTPGMGETRPLPPLPETQEKEAPLPNAPKPQDDAERVLTRCNQPDEAQRSACLREERNATAGATARREPPTAPPPQNPR